MRALAAAALLALSASGCGRTLTVYNRTSPRRVEVDKQVSEPVITATATRSDAGVELRIKRARSVRLSRVLHYNAEAVIYDHSNNPANELVETVVGLLLLAVPTAFWELGERLDGRESPAREVVRERRVFLALLDPTRSVFTNNIRTDPVVAESVFADPPRVREYQMALPASETEVRFRALDEAGRAVGSGSIETDLHGSALVFEGIGDTAIAVELRVDGQTVVVPIASGPRPATAGAGADDRGLAEINAPEDGDTPAPAPPEPPDEPDEPDEPDDLDAPVAERRPDAAVGSRWRPVEAPRPPLPRATATIDLVPLFESDTENVFLGQLIAEIRVLPRASVSGIFGFGNVLLDSVIAFALQGGGQARYYAWGDFRRGFHLGVEGLYTSFEEGALTDPRFELGPMLGYKHAFNVGFTAEIQAGALFRLAGDELEAGYLPLVNLSLGWSF